MKTIAIIGASQNRERYSNKAIRAYQKQGWTVFPVLPSGETVERIEGFKSIEDIPGELERASVYVRPEIGITILDGIISKKPKEVYLNPGTASDEIKQRLQQAGISVVEACSIVDIGETPADY